MWPDEIVMTPNEFKVLFETLLVACVSGSFSSQICTGPAGGEVGSLAEGGVQFDRVLRLLECAVDLASGSDHDPRLHLPASVLAPRSDSIKQRTGNTLTLSFGVHVQKIETSCVINSREAHDPIVSLVNEDAAGFQMPSPRLEMRRLRCPCLDLHWQVVSAGDLTHRALEQRDHGFEITWAVITDHGYSL